MYCLSHYLKIYFFSCYTNNLNKSEHQVLVGIKLDKFTLVASCLDSCPSLLSTFAFLLDLLKLAVVGLVSKDKAWENLLSA